MFCMSSHILRHFMKQNYYPSSQMRAGHICPTQDSAPLTAVIRSEGHGTRSGEQEAKYAKTSLKQR